MLFKVIYILFFFASFVYGSLQIAGPITPRHIMTLVMLAMCFREGMPKFDRYMMVYLAFLVCFLFSGVVYGKYFADTIKWAFAEHFVAIVAFQATRILITKYNAAYVLIYTYLAIGAFDAFVTIGQYHVGPYAELIMKAMNNNMTSNQLDSSEYHGGDTMAGFVPPGIVGSVPNGYLLAATTILSLYNRRTRIRLWNIVLFLFCLYALYCVQEKTALVAGAFLSFFYLYKNAVFSAGSNTYVKSLIRMAVVLFGVLVVFGFFFMIGDDEEMRYNQGFEMTDERNQLIQNAIIFITQNPFGGIFEYNRLNHNLPPHNLFLNAFVWGGYVGGLAIFLLLTWKAMTLIKVALDGLTGKNTLKYVVSLVYVSFTLNSLTHNHSIVMGDFYFWAFWAVCMLQPEQVETERKGAVRRFRLFRRIRIFRNISFKRQYENSSSL